MNLLTLTQKEQIQTLSQRWCEKYFILKSGGNYTPGWAKGNLNQNGWYLFPGIDTQEYYNRLLALPENATREDVVTILGENWTREWIEMLQCYECKMEREEIVELCDCEEEGPVHLCKNCLQKALDLFS